MREKEKVKMSLYTNEKSQSLPSVPPYHNTERGIGTVQHIILKCCCFFIYNLHSPLHHHVFYLFIYVNISRARLLFGLFVCYWVYFSDWNFYIIFKWNHFRIWRRPGKNGMSFSLDQEDEFLVQFVVKIQSNTFSTFCISENLIFISFNFQFLHRAGLSGTVRVARWHNKMAQMS